MGCAYARCDELLSLSDRSRLAGRDDVLGVLPAHQTNMGGGGFRRPFCCQRGTADPASERLIKQLVELRPDLATALAAIRTACEGKPALCIASTLLEAGPDRFTLVNVKHPTSDWIRFADNAETVRVDGRVIAIDGFARKTAADLQTALAELGPGPVDIDLRQNPGGMISQMQRVAIQLIEEQGGPPSTFVRRVHVSTVTASAGEVLAAMLIEAGAELCGNGPTAGEAYRKAVLAVDHDWRLIARLEPFALPGLNQEGRLVPSERCGN